MKRGEMLLKCEDLITSFNPNITTVDSHFKDQIGDESDRNPEKIFMKQILYGCVRFKKPLHAFLTIFFQNNSATTNRQDITMYKILAYLAIFRLQELTFPEFSKFVSAQDPAKMNGFLKYLFDADILENSIKGEWIQLYDRDYVENDMIGCLEKFRPDVERLCDQLKVKATGRDAKKQEKEEALKNKLLNKGKSVAEKKSKFKPNPPKLCPPKPRAVKEPVRIEQNNSANSRPQIDLEKNSLSVIEERKRLRKDAKRLEVQQKYSNPANQPFKLHETRSNIDTVRAEVEARCASELQFEGQKAKPAPSYRTPANVRLNMGSILREDALYKKKQEEEAKMIKAYEADLHDASEFYRWQSDMKAKDADNHWREVERRRLEMAACQQEAIEASIRQKAHNKQMATQMKEENHFLLQNAKREEEVTVLLNQRLVGEVKHVRETAPRIAMENVRIENIKRCEELTRQKSEAMENKKREDEKERLEREDKIRQIKALERVPKSQVAEFDPTKSSGVGLLEELSLAELRERLASVKERDREKEDDRRSNIIREKEEKRMEIMNRMQNLARIRDSSSRMNKSSRERRKQLEAESKEQEQERRNRGNLELSKKIARARALRSEELAKLEEEEKAMANQRMFLGAAKNMIEEQHFDDQLRGAEREAKERQLKAKQAAITYETSRVQESKIRKNNTKKETDALLKTRNETNRVIGESRRDLAEKEHQQSELRKTNFQDERSRKEMARTKVAEKNKYAHTQTQNNIAKARTLRS